MERDSPPGTRTRNNAARNCACPAPSLIARPALLRSAGVVRFRLWLATAFALGAIVGSVLRAQVSDVETGKGEQSVKKRHRAHSFSPAPEKSPSPIAKAKPVSSKSKEETDTSPAAEKSPSPIAKAAKKSGEEETVPKSKPSETPEPTVASAKHKKSPSATPKARAGKKKSTQKKKASPTPKKTEKGKGKTPLGTSETPKPEKSPRPTPEESRVPSENPTPPPPHAIAAPTPTPSPQTKVPRAVSADDRGQVVIEKSGFEEDQGLEPPPTPPPRRFGFWPWSRSRSSESYRYLTRSVIEQIRRAPVQRRRWQFIVVHNSGTRQGNARAFDYYHRHVRRMQNGLAYHFVIGNGTSTGNGQIEVGDRWRRQINGGHVHSDYLNNISLGICLVGDFNRDQPTRAQLESCEELIRYLRQRCGKTGGHEIVVRPHREMNPPRWATDCPGDVFPYSWFRRF
ncbi:MAG: hypothetical protein DME81_02485 [Verrucomicrobia bacterium]|nr:MAG: hypothetical protein DME81_02485 [Verrucomicrobiota bacterium]